MDNWLLIPCHNNSDLLQTCIESVLAQTIPVRIFAINNSSTDNTSRVLAGLDNKHIVVNAYPQLGVAGAWNYGLTWIFRSICDRNLQGVPASVLVCNQDIILRPDTYETLLKQRGDFVTAVSTGDKQELSSYVQPDVQSRRPHPDFSCFLITRCCFQTTGPFDEDFYPAWFEDNDYHIRMAKAGIYPYCIDFPFYHYAAGTIKRARQEGLAEPYDVAFRANQKRFYEKWGVLPGTKEYEELCTPN